jgi:hypothetical protein
MREARTYLFVDVGVAQPRPAIQQGADGNMYVAGVRTGVPSVQTSIGLDGRVHVIAPPA